MEVCGRKVECLMISEVEQFWMMTKDTGVAKRVSG